jgi:hypothetical protein
MLLALQGVEHVTRALRVIRGFYPHRHRWLRRINRLVLRMKRMDRANILAHSYIVARRAGARYASLRLL